MCSMCPVGIVLFNRVLTSFIIIHLLWSLYAAHLIQLSANSLHLSVSLIVSEAIRVPANSCRQFMVRRAGALPDTDTTW